MQADLRFAGEEAEAAFFDYQTERNHTLETQVRRSAMFVFNGSAHTQESRACRAICPPRRSVRPAAHLALREQQKQCLSPR
jgi:hypothetical protein